MNNRAWTILIIVLVAGLLIYSVMPDGPEFNININGNDYEFENWRDLGWEGIFIGLFVICILAVILIPLMLGLSLLSAGIIGLALFLVFLAFAPLLLPGVILILLIYLLARKSR